MDNWQYQPARDLDLTPAERWRSVRRECGLLEWSVQAGWWFMVRTYLNAYHRLRIVGLHHIPTAVPFVMAANHSSHLDAMVIVAALPNRVRRHVLPLAAGDTFFETPSRAAFAAWCLNALPLWRYNCGRHAINDLRERVVSEPCGYVLFPEGTRSRTGEPETFKAGIGMLVAATDVPVVPCYLQGTHRAWPPQSRWPHRHPVQLHIGQPMNFRDTPNRKVGWQTVAQRTESAVRRLAADASPRKS